jgi:predicted enzyme related to lactoylglutathione lyase
MQLAARAGDPQAEGDTPMTNPAPGTLAWFEVATSDPDGAEKFYGRLFGWTFAADGPAASGGMDYRNITASGADGPIGGILGTGGKTPDHAVFYILVADVDATCAGAEQFGGSVVAKHLDPGPGAPKFAYLRDPSGNQFGVFSPPAA